MKKFYIVCVAIATLFINGCSDDDRSTDFINQVGAPSNLDVEVEILQDNSGTVNFTLSGDNVSSFSVDYGDDSEIENFDTVQTVSHIYTEGTFTVTLVAASISGETTSITQDIILTFNPPEDLEITVNLIEGNPFGVEVRAEANFATSFDVFFGDVVNETPENFLVGTIATHIYEEEGTYEIRVVARNASSVSIEQTTSVIIEAPENPVGLPIDFENNDTLMYEFGGFEGADSALDSNPDISGENTSATVMRTIKTEGAQFFAGTFLRLDVPIAFTDNMGSISINTWSPKANIPVRMRLENEDNTSGIELDVNTTVANTWETLTFDFSSMIDPALDYVTVVVFFEFIVDLSGDGSTYYFDNIELTGEGGNDGTGVELPVDFEDNDTLMYDFLGFEGADSALEANPDASGENTSATVMRSIKTDGAQFFAGTLLNLDTQIAFTDNMRSISIQTYSPEAGVPIRLAIENQVIGGQGSQIFVDVNTTVSDSWETLTFDFSSLIDSSISYDRVVVFFDFVVDQPGDGSTYYFDNIELTN